MRERYLGILFCFCIVNAVYAQYGTVTGSVVDERGVPIEAAVVELSPGAMKVVTGATGEFKFTKVSFGTYTASVSTLAYKSFTGKVEVRDNIPIVLNVVLEPSIEKLPEVEVVANRTFNNVSFMPKVKGTEIFAGKKSTVVNLQSLDADIAENLPRQVFAKVPGVMVWEMDGTGNQVGIATRGLIPHRSWELHVQQNGNTTNSDLFGYPESHYNPPIEAVGEIRVVRGSGALQYGPQFGGLLDYEIRQPDTSREIAVETQETVGSFGLFSAFNSIGGKVGRVTYYGYYNFRRADGWRDNSDYHFTAWHGSVKYDINPDMQLSAELSHMQYVNHFAAGLTDAMFEENPRQSNRPRNYFNPTIYVPAVHFDWSVSDNTILSVKTSAILGQRNSVQFITLPTINDTVNTDIGSYNPRQVDRDYYHSYSGEVRLLQHYDFLDNESHLAIGVKYGTSSTDRRQKGKGTGNTDFDLALTQPYRIDLEFNTDNYALFAENVFNLTDKFSVTPGFRYEVIHSEMSGVIVDQPALQLPYTRERSLPLFGVGMEYAISRTLNTYVNFTQNFRPILHSDLIPPTDLDRIDPDLNDAKGNNSELGVRGTLRDVVQFDINYFRLQYNNRIGTLILNDAGTTYFYHTNVGDMLNQGMECYIEFHPLNLSDTPPMRSDLTLFTSTAYNSAHYTSGTISVAGENTDITDNVVENVPTWISRNGITYRRQKLSATLQVSYVSENFSDALNTVSTTTGVNGIVPSYVLTDVNLTYFFLDRYNLRCSVNNITDEKYYTRRATGYPGPGILPSDGRSVVVSFGATF